MILGSGGATHNLGAFGLYTIDAEPVGYARAFDDWLYEAVTQNKEQDFLEYRTTAPETRRNHPTAEHFMPLFVPLGAGADDPAQRIHSSFAYRVLSMAAYAWGSWQ